MKKLFGAFVLAILIAVGSSFTVKTTPVDCATLGTTYFEVRNVDCPAPDDLECCIITEDTNFPDFTYTEDIVLYYTPTQSL